MIKRPGSDADNSPPSSAAVKNAWSYTYIHQYAFTAWCSVKKSTGTTLSVPPLILCRNTPNKITLSDWEFEFHAGNQGLFMKFSQVFIVVVAVIGSPTRKKKMLKTTTILPTSYNQENTHWSPSMMIWISRP